LGLTILHTNDLHGKLEGSRFEILLEARRSVDLYFDSGDCVKAGNLAVPVHPDPVWARLHEADCTASVIGNRETHLIESAFWAKLAGREHPVLAANLRRKDGSRPLPGYMERDIRGLRVGILGVSVPMVTERMVARTASAFLWDDPLESARALAEESRPRVDLLIALTHIGHAKDLALAEGCPGIDVILGGHSHTVLESPVLVGRTYVCQGGSHGRFMGRYEWSSGVLSGGLHPWV
jgi:2',3'-cyclic-nucleotide 2'-phosphodiesterase (5'-nucleotidase family)